MTVAKVDHKPTQNERILDYIKRFGSITQDEASNKLGVKRLASRVSDLKRLGYPITSELVVVQNRFGEKCRVARYRIGSSNG
jgi:predicted ArsR family transcriptional regulator